MTDLIPASPQIVDILRAAVERGVDVEVLERLAALHERISDRNAAMEYNHAVANFQAECPPIEKTSKAAVSTTGGGYAYRWAELDQIAATIRPVLQKHGLSYSWDSDVTADGMLTVTCTIKHIGGHRETAKFSAPTKAKTSAMNAQQEVAAALTYAKRYSLISALGLTTCDPGSDNIPRTAISADDVASLEAAITSTGTDRARFLVYMEVGDLAELAVKDLPRARQALKSKLGAKS